MSEQEKAALQKASEIVYVVFYGNYEPRKLYEIYSTEALAKEAVERSTRSLGTGSLGYQAWRVKTSPGGST